MPEITLRNVTKKWDKFVAVDNLSMDIDDGAFITLLGPSGCGKTTTLRMIAGLETPTSGQITMNGVTVFDSDRGINLPASKRDVGFLFQNYALWPHMTVYQNIAFGLENLKWDRARIDARVKELLALLRIEKYEKRYPAELSGGQQQRVAIARTLAPEPQVLFMDEPLSNLDAKLRLEMRYELQRLHLETGSTFVYVTHDQMEAMTLATRICLINNGVLQQYAAPLEVYNRPSNLFVADFVGNPSMNFIDAKGEQESDGSIRLKVLGGMDARFIPNDPMDLREWQKKRDQDAEDKQNAEKERLKKKGAVEKTNKDEVFKYHVQMVEEEDDSIQDEPVVTDSDFVLGVRPEAIGIVENGGLSSTIYGAMPTGMESTLKLRVGDYLLTSVIFGGVIYQIGQETGIEIKGKDILLFDRKSGRIVSAGSLAIG